MSTFEEFLTGGNRGRPMDAQIELIQTQKLSGSFSLRGPSGGIQAVFKDGLLHCEDGPAWSEYYGSEREKKAWALNGVVLAIDNDDYRTVIKHGIEESVPRIDFIELGIRQKIVGTNSVPQQTLQIQ